MRPLKTRVNAPRHSDAGFTLVELLVVIVVIAILAALIIVAYNGIQDRAHSTTAQSDTTNASKLLSVASIYNGSYPNDLSTVNNGGPLPSSDGSTYLYHPSNNNANYCLTVINGSSSYMVTDTATLPTQGYCPGDGGGGGSTITNLITNPSMEVTVSDYKDKSDSPATVSRITTNSKFGAASLRAAYPSTGSTGTTIETANTAAVTGGAQYMVSGYIYQETGVSRNCWLNINWFTSSKSYINQTIGSSQATPSTVGGWVRYSLSGTAPANAAYLAIQFRFGTATVGDAFDIDGAMATAGTTLYNYADGSSSGWSWTGAVNSSSSTGPAL